MKTRIYSSSRNLVRTPAPAALLALAATLGLVSCTSAGKPGGDETREPAAADPTEFFRDLPEPGGQKHVHLMHLDGFRPDLFKLLVSRGQLPHFQFLLSRGKVSYTASTVDKSETMKAIQSYLTSQRDTEVVGWWQFDRERKGFRNFRLDPVEVINYAGGLEFPRYPTIFDFLAAKKQRVVAGFHLHRRGVPIHDYTRAYVEGASAIFKHNYFDQAHATMESLLAKYQEIGEKQEPLPVLSTSLLAPTDKYTRLNGVTGLKGAAALDRGGFKRSRDFCFARLPEAKAKSDILERFFRMIDEDDETGGRLRRIYEKGLSPEQLAEGEATGWFSRLKRDRSGKPREICVRIPSLNTYAHPSKDTADSIGAMVRKTAEPYSVLGMIMIDAQLGRLIDKLRSIRFDKDGTRFSDAWGDGIEAYLQRGVAENSLFERTLFVFTGDHGMIDTKNMMGGDDPRREKGSSDLGLIETLNRGLRLSTADPGARTAESALLGIDDAIQPSDLLYPHLDQSWQSPEIRRVTNDARRWATEFFQEIRETMRAGITAKYWWLFVLRKNLAYQKLDDTLGPHRDDLINTLAALYLRGEPSYVQALAERNRAYYDRHVRLVYGGGARNNAELFLPAPAEGGGYAWNRRPSFDEILDYKPRPDSDRNLLSTIMETPSVGLIFIRKQNDRIAGGQPLPERMEILVMDRADNRGLITVWRDADSGELVFHYRKEEGSERDPLGYGCLGDGDGTFGTYSEWNDISVRRNHYYHNAVAGMGSYLYSANPSIGDVVLMHAQGWNFGHNPGGNGGIHREEKLTLMMVSGPGIRPGELKARARLRTHGEGEVKRADWETSPTVLDIAPTIMEYLGHGSDALSRWGRQDKDGFVRYLRAWIKGQRAGIMANLDRIEGISNVPRILGFEYFRLSKFDERIRRLLKFLPDDLPPMPDLSRLREEGNVLKLRD